MLHEMQHAFNKFPVLRKICLLFSTTQKGFTENVCLIQGCSEEEQKTPLTSCTDENSIYSYYL